MGFDIENYTNALKDELITRFGERLLYMGLQGSHMRGEATENSDIDVVVILDDLTLADMKHYREAVEKSDDSQRSCGFICSRSDLQNWNRLEICQLIHATRDLYGTLTDFTPEWSMIDEAEYIKLSLNNLYHAFCHTYIHGTSEELAGYLPEFYKQAYFILQNLHFLRAYLKDPQNARFVLTKAALAEESQGEDKAVMETLLGFSAGASLFPERDTELIFTWCKQKSLEISDVLESLGHQV